jgi:streptogramin lyase
MNFMTIVRSLFGRGGRPRRQPVRYRPEVTALEGRWLPSTITEFPLPPNNNGAGFTPVITNGPDGNLWFTDPAARSVGRITPTGQVTEFAPPSPDNGPSRGAGSAITTGPDGNVWFATEAFTNSISRVTPDGQFATFGLPGILGSVNGLTAGPDGNVWFTESVYPFTVEKVGFITPTGEITEFSISVPPGVRGSIGSITTGPDGNLWFTHDRTLATITPTGVLRDHVADNVGDALTTGPDGNLWASGPGFDPLTGRLAGDFIQRISVTGSVTTFSVGTFSLSHSAITAGPDGNLWFTEPDSNEIGRITPDGQITLYPVPTPGSLPTGIAAGSDGNVWFTEGASRHIGEIVVNGTPPAPAAATATALAIDVSKPSVGQTVHLTATVTSAAGTPTGTVSFYNTFSNGKTFLGTADLNGAGQAVLTTVFQFGPTENLTAVYNGSPAFAASTSPALLVKVSPVATTTTLTASATTVAVGRTLVLKVTVTPAFTGAGAPTGTIVLKDGNTTIRTATLIDATFDPSGRAVFRFVAGRPLWNHGLPRGTHHLTVSYLGDGANAASVSAALDVTVA